MGRSKRIHVLLNCFLWLSALSSTEAYTHHVTRRKAFDIATTDAALLGAQLLSPNPSFAADFDTDARLSLPVKTTEGKAYSISIPRIGYSLYKTEPEQVPKCLELAVQAGVQHFDVATLYSSNTEVGAALKSYIAKGIDYEPNPTSSRSERRKRLFIAHKVSNKEQSKDKSKVKRAVKDEMRKLQVNYLDLCSVHSPLTDKEHRLSTYDALLDLQNEGIVKAVGVCNFGVNPLRKSYSQNHRQEWAIFLLRCRILPFCSPRI